MSIPYKALRECCINSLCHRSYHHPGSSVSIAIYDDRVEVTNTGTFPADLSVERLMQEHDSKPQNPIIANVLYKSKILESWGRGIGTMVDECKRVGLPVPEFKTDGNFVTVVFKYNRNGVNLQLVNSNPTSTQQVPNKYPTSTQQVLELVGILKDGEYSVREIMSFLMLKDRVNFLYKYLTPALEEGLVSMKYPDNPKHPKQKYLLTEKGRKILEK